MRNIKVWGLDVWGNEKDGFEVNDRYECFEEKVRDNFFSWGDKKVVRWLKDRGLIKSGIHTKSIEIDGDGETYYYINDSRNGRPEYQIELY